MGRTLALSRRSEFHSPSRQKMPLPCMRTMATYPTPTLARVASRASTCGCPGAQDRTDVCQPRPVMPVDLDTVRLFLHVLAATVWVGGQLVLAALVPALRATGSDIPKV